MNSATNSDFWYKLNEFSEIEELTQPLSNIYSLIRDLSLRSLVRFKYKRNFGVLRSKTFAVTTTNDILLPVGIKVFPAYQEIFSFNSLDLNLKILFEMQVCFYISFCF